jgi:4-hydroxy 2-oxovalerate aldolase
MKDIEIFDCTLRDGGYVNDWKFSDEQVIELYKNCILSNIDYVELGFRNFKKKDFLEKYGPTFFCDEDYINKVIGENYNNKCKIAIMVTINQFDFNDFVPKSESKIDLVRVLMAYHGFKNKSDDEIDMKTLEDGINQINKLNKLGYETTFNIGRIDKLNKDQLIIICNLISKTKIKYFYMADTYGSIDIISIQKLMPFIRNLLPYNIKLGFHSHDNCSDASVKALYSLNFEIDIIDCCVLGYGRGSGNAKTELFLMHLNKNYNKNYNFINIIEYGDKYLINYKECSNNLCYNVNYALTSYLGCHVNYAIDIIEKYDKMNIIDIYNILLEIKKMNNHMFYYDNLFLELYNNKLIC